MCFQGVVLELGLRIVEVDALFMRTRLMFNKAAGALVFFSLAGNEE